MFQFQITQFWQRKHNNSISCRDNQLVYQTQRVMALKFHNFQADHLKVNCFAQQNFRNENFALRSGPKMP